MYRYNVYRHIKRGLDILFAVCALVLTSPVFLFAALAIRLDSPGPVFFRQKRVGRAHSYFRMVKFRTMRVDAPADRPTHLLGDADAYITRVGRFLRKSSLDELPQLLQVLRGQMSLVGPRPALWNQYDLMELRAANGSAALRPGLTGWAQVNGRDELPIAVKAALDGYYAAHISLGLDARILWRTGRQVLCGAGVVEGEKKSGSPV